MQKIDMLKKAGFKNNPYGDAPKQSNQTQPVQPKSVQPYQRQRQPQQSPTTTPQDFNKPVSTKDMLMESYLDRNDPMLKMGTPNRTDEISLDPDNVQQSSNIFLPNMEVENPQVNQSSQIFNPTAPEQNLTKPTETVSSNTQYGNMPELNPDVITHSSQIFDPIENGGQNNEQTNQNPSNPEGFQDVYDQLVMDGLTGQNANVESARNNAERDNKYQSYVDEKHVQEMLMAQGLEPGSLEYQRALDRQMANTNSANLGRTNTVNQYQRDTFNDSMNMAEGVVNRDIQQGNWQDIFDYNAGRDEVMDNRYQDETEYDREQDAYYQEQTEKLQTKQDFEGFIQMQPQKIQNILRPLLASGDYDAVKAKINEMYSNGTIQGDYKPATSSQALMDSIVDDWSIRSPKPEGMSDEEWKGQLADSNNDGKIDENDEGKTIGDMIMDSYSQVQDTERNPLGDATQTEIAKDEQKARISSFIETGDFSEMSPEDWSVLQTNPTEMKKAIDAGHISYFADKQLSSPWKEDAEVSNSSAKQKFSESHGYSEGDIIEKDGVLYRVTNTSKKTGSKQWEMGTYQTRNQISLMAVPVGGGSEIALFKSQEYDPD